MLRTLFIVALFALLIRFVWGIGRLLRFLGQGRPDRPGVDGFDSEGTEIEEAKWEEINDEDRDSP